MLIVGRVPDVPFNYSITKLLNSSIFQEVPCLRAKHLCPPRHHVNVTPFEARVGGLRHPRNLKHDAAARIYANEGVCQILFFLGNKICETSYADRKGAYQAKKGIVLPKLQAA